MMMKFRWGSFGFGLVCFIGGSIWQFVVCDNFTAGFYAGSTSVFFCWAFFLESRLLAMKTELRKLEDRWNWKNRRIET